MTSHAKKAFEPKPILDVSTFSTVVGCHRCSWRSVHNTSEEAEREWSIHFNAEHSKSVARHRNQQEAVATKKKPKRKLRRIRKLKRHLKTGAK